MEGRKNFTEMGFKSIYKMEWRRGCQSTGSSTGNCNSCSHDTSHNCEKRLYRGKVVLLHKKSVFKIESKKLNVLVWESFLVIFELFLTFTCLREPLTGIRANCVYMHHHILWNKNFFLSFQLCLWIKHLWKLYYLIWGVICVLFHERDCSSIHAP